MANKEQLKKRIERAGEFGHTNACCIIDAVYDLKKSMDNINTKELAKQIKYLQFELEELRRLKETSENIGKEKSNV